MQRILLILAILLPGVFAFTSIVSGNVILWYDSARDLLSAWNNLEKLTLIGPTSGIPGIFYGPYWIWLLSSGLFFSKNPSVPLFVAGLIPYLILFPLVWWQFTKFFGKSVFIIGWLLFILGTGMTYATQLWNPYPAPLITLGLIYLLIITESKKLTKNTLIKGIGIGFLLGLLINFHISFGLGVTVGTAFFLLWDWYSTRAKLVTKIGFFSLIFLGFLCAFAPLFIFELRHGFQQIQVMFNALSHYGAVVTLHGLTKVQIFQAFFETFGKLLHTSTIIAEIFFIASAIWMLIRVQKKKIAFNKQDVRILSVVISLLLGIGLLYFTARNPVWIYHFIGVEIILLLLTALFASKIPLIKYGLALWVIYLFCQHAITFIQTFEQKGPSSLVAQKAMVQRIMQDANGENYTVVAYVASIYQYEYTYLFRWLAGKDIPYDPSQAILMADTVYLIVPSKKSQEAEDFIQFRKPDSDYRTIKTWDEPYSKKIIKRAKK